MPAPAVKAPARTSAFRDAVCTANCQWPSADSPSSKPAPPTPVWATAVAGVPAGDAAGVSQAPALKLCRVSTTEPSVPAGSRLADPKVRTPGTPFPEPSQATPGGSSNGRAPFGCQASTPAVSATHRTVTPPAPQSAAAGTAEYWSVVHWCVTGYRAATSWTVLTGSVAPAERRPPAVKAQAVNWANGGGPGPTGAGADGAETERGPPPPAPRPPAGRGGGTRAVGGDRQGPAEAGNRGAGAP